MNLIAKAGEFFRGRNHKEEKKHSHGVEIHEAGGGLNISPQNVKNFVVKAVGNIEDSSNGDFSPPESDLGEIRDAIATDSYLKLAVSKYSQLIFKAGYHIVSDNDAAAEYIQQRFSLMSFTTRTPMDVLFQGVADDLVAYSNAFLLRNAQGGNAA